MARLIDADAFVAQYCKSCCGGCDLDDERCDTVDDLMEAPTVDAVEVVHGYWIDSYSVDHMRRIIEHSIDCSVCDSVFKADRRDVVQHWKEQFKVCPFCGAVMDGGNEDG